MPTPKARRRRLTAVDLFAGCGGMTQGLKKAGFHVLGAVELEELAAKTYKLNHRGVHVWTEDIRGITGSAMLKALSMRPGELDLLTGCPPCQGFSSMRRLNGARYVRDDRNDLLFHFLRFVKQLKPKTVMFENVPGLQTFWRWPEFIRDLEKQGYHPQYKVLNAANFGVPQRRRRLILIAAKNTEVRLLERAGKPATVRAAIASLPRPGKSGDRLHDLPSRHGEKVRDIIRRIPKNGGGRDALGKDQLDCHVKFRGFHDVYGRMAWDDVAPTITGGCVNPSKGRFLHPSQNRAVTVREAALLQTFPRKYRFSLDRGKYPAALLVGNALPPEFARRSVKPLVDHLRKSHDAR